MNRKHVLSALVFVGALLFTVSGCGEDKGVKVSGSVTKGGKAEAGIRLVFISHDKEKSLSKGTSTGPDGKFQLHMKPGKYTVTMTKWVDKNGKVRGESENPDEDFTQLEASGKLTQVLPQLYTEQASSPFSVDIPAGGKDLPPFELK